MMSTCSTICVPEARRISRVNSSVQIQWLLLTLYDASIDVRTQKSGISTVSGKPVKSLDCRVPISHR